MNYSERISESRKILLRNSAESKINASTKTEVSVQVYGTSEQSEGNSDVLKECNRIARETNGLNFKNNVAESARSFSYSQDCSTTVDIASHDKASKRLNIPFDEVVYQDLISLSETRMKIKHDQMIMISENPRRLKNLDPEPEPRIFFRPVKQEFIFCDILGKSMDVSGEEIENTSQSYHFKKAREFNDHMNYDCMSDTVEGSDNGNPSTNEERVHENEEGDMNCIERLKKLHENHGLDTPQLKAYFEGTALHKRSQAWKLNMN